MVCPFWDENGDDRAGNVSKYAAGWPRIKQAIAEKEKSFEWETNYNFI